VARTKETASSDQITLLDTQSYTFYAGSWSITPTGLIVANAVVPWFQWVDPQTNHVWDVAGKGFKVSQPITLQNICGQQIQAYLVSSDYQGPGGLPIHRTETENAGSVALSWPGGGDWIMVARVTGTNGISWSLSGHGLLINTLFPVVANTTVEISGNLQI